jgi:hypothetical protein
MTDELTADYIADRWPRLFHMAEAGSWESIQRNGLRSTTALLDLFEISGDEREALEARHRAESVRIMHPVHGIAWIRDNKPITPSVLGSRLVGMNESDWYRTLNRRVFFWLTERRLDKIRLAKANRDRAHEILVIDTAELLARYASRVELSPFNSGSAFPADRTPRGVGTFTAISDYPWEPRRRTAPSEPIVELTVDYMVEGVAQLIVDVVEVPASS